MDVVISLAKADARDVPDRFSAICASAPVAASRSQPTDGFSAGTLRQETAGVQ
jgi:hypothetical protein